MATTTTTTTKSAPATTTATTSGSSYSPAQVAAINAAREANYNAGINVYTGAGATAASNAAGKGNTAVSPAFAGETVAPATPASTPIDTSQPSPTTATVTPASDTTSAGPAVASAAQAQQNLLNGGLKGSDLAAAQKSLSAFQQAHNAAVSSGQTAPQDAGAGMSVATKAASDVPQSYAPAPEVQDAVAKATQKYTDDFAKAMSSQDQSKSLVQTYQDLTDQLGIPALNTQLMNMKNVIDGTEDDIRNEVTKASGFATDSQVLAMTNARNKTMIQNYNNLLQTRSDAMQQLTTLSGLAAQDKQFAAAQIDRQLNFDQAQITFATNAQKNAQDSIQKSIDNYGAAQVLKQALATGDPTAVARINATMGNGFDLKTAAAAGPTLDQQVKQANIAQSYASIRASDASAANAYSEIKARNNPAPKPQTQAQVVAQGYAERANAANAIISKLGSKFAAPTALGGATIFGIGLPNALKSQDRQAYEQAQREFVNSVLRPESGASISPSEFASAEKEYFPQPGDSQSAIRNKAVDRQLKINSLQVQGTNSSVPEAGQVVNYQGGQYTVDANGNMTPI